MTHKPVLVVFARKSAADVLTVLGEGLRLKYLVWHKLEVEVEKVSG